MSEAGGAASESGASSFSGGSEQNALDVANVRSDDDGFVDEGRSLQQGLFGVLYTVSKEKAPGWKLASFRLFVDVWQLVLLMVNPAYGYTGFINSSNSGWQAISVISLNQFMSARGYTFFIAVLYLMAIGLVFVILLCMWVANSFRQNRFDQVWPITMLRWYSVVFFQILDVASLSLFLITLDCNYFFDSGAPGRYHHQEFPDVYCWEMPHLVHVFVSVVSLIIYTALAALFSMAEVELNPVTRNPMAMEHTKVEVIGFGIKFVMTAATSFMSNLKWLSVIQTASSLYLLYLYAYWVPHTYTVVNNVRVASYTMVSFCAGMLLLQAFMPGVDQSDDDAVSNWQHVMTNLMWAGLAPAAALGWFISYRRQRYFSKTVLDRFSNAAPDAKPKSVFKFTDPREVAILCRCCRVWVDEDTLDDDATHLAETIMKAGVAMLPAEPYMIILYSSFLIDVQTSYQSGYTILQTAKKQDPSFLERFAIFSREQQHTQKSAAEGGAATDLVSWVEFQRNYRLVLKVHREALLAMRAFWMCLLQHKVMFDRMSNTVERMDTAIKTAERTYRAVLQRHANNMKIVRLYAKFLEGVKHDPWNAAKWFAEAEKLEQQAEETKASNVFEDIAIADPALRMSLMAMGPLSDNRAIVIINAQSQVQMTNQAACEMLGFSKSDLVGRNVNVIIPSPFAEHHSTYIRNHLVSGKAVLLERTTEMVALHKDRYVLPIMLTVTKVSGIGEDSKFMGLMEPVAPTNSSSHNMGDCARFWVLWSGQVLSADMAFFDWFGFRPDEMAGTPLSNYVVESRKLDEVLRLARQAHLAAVKKTLMGTEQRTSSIQIDKSNHSGRSYYGGAANRSMHGGLVTHPASPKPHIQLPSEYRISGLHMVHKFADAVEVDIEVTNAGIGSHQFNMLTIRRPDSSPAPHTFVSDKKGRLLHVTSGVAQILGTSAKALMSNGGRNALEALIAQPWAQLHRTLGQSIPPHAPPPFSCRAELSVLLAAVGPQGPESIPFRLQMKRRHAGGESDTYNIVTLEHTTLQQALAERHITLTVDARGYVVDVPGGSSEVFGFSARTLKGMHVSSFIDIMSPPSGSTDHAPLRSTVGTPTMLHRRDSARAPRHMAMLNDTAEHISMFDGHGHGGGKETEKAAGDGEGQDGEEGGRDFRPKVSDPLLPLGEDLSGPPGSNGARNRGARSANPREDPFLARYNESEPPSGEKLEHTLGYATPEEEELSAKLLLEMVSKSVVSPGISWRVGVHSPSMDTHSLFFQLGMLDHPAAGRMGTGKAAIMMVEPAPPAKSQDPQARTPARTSGGARSRALLNTMGVSSNFRRGSTVVSMATTGELANVRYNVKLWRSKLACSVLELDGQGQVLATHHDKEAELYPPGLLLGKPNDELFGAHVREILPSLGPRGGVADLFEGLDMLPQQSRPVSAKKPKGLLKGTAPAALEKPPGPVNLFKCTHRGDGGEIMLSVQAVPKLGRSDHVFLVMHPYQPLCGRPDFAKWVSEGGLQVTAAKEAEQEQVQLLRMNSAHHLAGPADLKPRLYSKSSHAKDHAASHATLQHSTSCPTLAHQAPAALPSSPDADEDEVPVAQKEAEPHGSIHDSHHSSHEGASLGSDPNLMTLDELVREVEHKVSDSGGPGSGLQADKAKPERASENSVSKGVRFGEHKAGGKKEHILSWIADSAGSLPSTSTGTPQGPGPRGSGNGLPASAAAGANGRVSFDGDVHGAMQTSRLAVMSNLQTVVEDEEAAAAVKRQDSYSEDGGDEDESSQSEVSADADKDKSTTHDPSASDLDEALPEQNTDYRRGKRLKKLTRILGSASVQRAAHRFKLHVLCIVGALTAAHVGIFVYMFVLLKSQKDGVQELNYAGRAIRHAGEMGLSTRQLDLLYNPIPVPDYGILPPGISGWSDVAPLLEWYTHNLAQFKDLHATFYLGPGNGRRLPDKFRLREIWEQPVLQEKVFFIIPNNESIDLSHYTQSTFKNSSLWDIGNSVYNAGYQIVHNGLQYNISFGQINTWSYFKYIMANMPNVMADGYFLTMDSMVQLTLEGADNVNGVQLVLMVVEGCCMCLAAAAYVWILTLQVAAQRFSIYSVFLSVPVALARGLATKRLDLDDEDDEEEVAAGDGGAAGAGAAGTIQEIGDINGGPKIQIGLKNIPGRASGNGSRDVDGSRPGLIGALAACWSHTLGAILFWRPRAKVGPASKRQLQQSLWQSVMLVWALLVWGLIIIVLYSIGISLLSQVSGPIAMFNMVNFVAARTHMFFYELQELVIEFDQDTMDKIRVRVNERLQLLKKDYTAMLYGGAALPNETSSHFTLATDGLAYAGGEGANILFYTTDCMAEDPKYCKGPESQYYPETHNGLARLMEMFMEKSDAVIQMHGLDPWLFGPEFTWFWNVRYDLLGGLNQLEQAYSVYVDQVYGQCVTIHTVALVLTLIVLLGFLLFILRPFINKTTNETRRIAELLSQLPADVDVESLLTRSLVSRTTSGGAVAAGSNKRRGSVDGLGAAAAYGGNASHHSGHMSLKNPALSKSFGSAKSFD